MTLTSALLTLGLTAALFSSAAVAAAADTLAKLKAKGEVIIGVKDGDAPFGYRNEDGQLIGLEIDLARDIAERLGVKLTLFPVSASGRMQFLQQDQIDLILATMGVTEIREQEAGLVKPYYYASSFALLIPHGAKTRSVSDLSGKAVCTIRSRPINGFLASRAPDIELAPFRDQSKALKALAAGKCAAFADEEPRLLYVKNQKSGGTAFDVIPIEVVPLPWAIAVQSAELGGDFGKFLSSTIADWHKSGKLVALEKKWLGENTAWLLHEKIRRGD